MHTVFRAFLGHYIEPWRGLYPLCRWCELFLVYSGLDVRDAYDVVVTILVSSLSMRSEERRQAEEAERSGGLQNLCVCSHSSAPTEMGATRRATSFCSAPEPIAISNSHP